MDKVEMKGEYNQFIGEYSCAYNSKFSDSIITAFDYYTSIDGINRTSYPVERNIVPNCKVLVT